MLESGALEEAAPGHGEEVFEELGPGAVLVELVEVGEVGREFAAVEGEDGLVGGHGISMRRGRRRGSGR